MDNITLMFKCICMNTTYLMLNKEDMEKVLEYCKTSNINIEHFINHPIDTIDMSNKQIKLFHSKKYFMYAHFIKKLYVYRNKELVYNILLKQPQLVKHNNSYTFKEINDDLGILEKSFINDALMTYKLTVSKTRQFELDKIVLPTSPSIIDGSQLCRNIYYNEKNIFPENLFMSRDSLQTTIFRHKGRSLSFLKMDFLHNDVNYERSLISSSNILNRIH